MPGDTCADLCRGREACSIGDTTKCEFIKNYRKQLDTIDVKAFVDGVEVYARDLLNSFGIAKDPLVVFIVHETITNPCSERYPLLEWFADNGLDVKELEYPIRDYY